MPTKEKVHKGNLNRILKDDRITGSRRILASLLSMWMDADGVDKQLLSAVLLGTFGGGQKIRWAEADEIAPNDQANTRLELDANKQIRDALANILGEKTE